MNTQVAEQVEKHDSQYRGGTLRYQNEDGTYTIVEIGSPYYSMQCFLATEVYDDELNQWRPIYSDMGDEDTCPNDKSKEQVIKSYKCNYLPAMGYVVWHDVFGGNMTCGLETAINTHKIAVFVTEEDANDYCNYRNSTVEQDITEVKIHSGGGGGTK